MGMGIMSDSILSTTNASHRVLRHKFVPFTPLNLELIDKTAEKRQRIRMMGLKRCLNEWKTPEPKDECYVILSAKDFSHIHLLSVGVR